MSFWNDVKQAVNNIYWNDVKQGIKFGLSYSLGAAISTNMVDGYLSLIVGGTAGIVLCYALVIREHRQSLASCKFPVVIDGQLDPSPK